MNDDVILLMADADPYVLKKNDNAVSGPMDQLILWDVLCYDVLKETKFIKVSPKF